MVKQFKIRVRHLGHSVSRFDFFDRVVAWNHYEAYRRDTEAGFFEAVEIWERQYGVVATGEHGEIVWRKLGEFPVVEKKGLD